MANFFLKVKLFSKPGSSCTSPTIRYTLLSTPVLCTSITNESSQAVHADCLHRQNFFKPGSSAPKIFLKALFISTSLVAAATRMSHAKVAPEGLKPQEWERNAGSRGCIGMYYSK